ncbi:hypothetical protein J8I87_36235 [Paraburkholderia sp. LEh10]|uniref:hypothetical protein n=1 Tax=Paraburkholderia sp. LEh10 TaxID=2821353 RepID=UPI001AE74A5E|nr:hypothetical protein [Paraburkholderia sp. LEh10]MBP0595019.1 hypothetical protein [Paraburkholderia sp. LEh10]
MSGLLEPDTTVAVILGASDWAKAGLARAGSFHRSAAYFQRYLLSGRPEGLGIHPDLLMNLFDDTSSPSSQLTRLKNFVQVTVSDRKETDKPIVDVLVYYVGHGTCDHGDTLHLLVRESEQGMEAESSISTPNLARALKIAAPQQRRICIFDCCFSEAAVKAFAGWVRWMRP